MKGFLLVRRLSVLWDKPKCINCDKEIKEDDIVFVKIKYPKRRGFTEIKAYLRNEGKFICESCYNIKSNLTL